MQKYDRDYEAVKTGMMAICFRVNMCIIQSGSERDDERQLPKLLVTDRHI